MKNIPCYHDIKTNWNILKHLKHDKDGKEVAKTIATWSNLSDNWQDYWRDFSALYFYKTIFVVSTQVCNKKIDEKMLVNAPQIFKSATTCLQEKRSSNWCLNNWDLLTDKFDFALRFLFLGSFHVQEN